MMKGTETKREGKRGASEISLVCVSVCCEGTGGDRRQRTVVLHQKKKKKAADEPPVGRRTTAEQADKNDAELRVWPPAFGDVWSSERCSWGSK